MGTALDAAAAIGGDGDVSGDVGEGERGNQRESECVWELEERERGFIPGRQVDEGSGWVAGSCVASMLCSPSSTCLLVLARASSLLAQQVGWAARWAGQVGSGKCSTLFSVSLLFIFCIVF